MYAGLMEEVKDRIAAIDDAVSGKIALKPEYVADFCWLQLRKVCEAVALACLVAHGDIVTAKRADLLKSWNSDKIIKGLADLAPDFFPLAVRRSQIKAKHHHMDVAPAGFLTKDEFLTLVGLSGNALHRGDFRSLSRRPQPVQKSHSEVVRWTQKIIDLLQEHRILFGEGPTVFYCVLNAADHGNSVVVWVAEVENPPVVD